MKNLLKADFYRLFKSISLYICTAVSVLIFDSGLLMIDWTRKLSDNQYLIFHDGISYGITAFMDSSVLMIIGIFTAIFVTAEFSHGTMKNLVSKGFSRQNIFISKLVTMTVGALLIVSATFAAGVAAATIVTGALGSVSWSFTSHILARIGIELLLYIALTALLVMIAMSIRNIGGVIAVDIVGVMIMEMMIFGILEKLVRGKIKFSGFSLMHNILYYRWDLGITGSDYVRSIFVAAAFFTASVVIGIFLFKKSDVK